MASGVTIMDECVLEYNKLKQGKNEPGKLRYFIMQLRNNNKEVQVTHTQERACRETTAKPEGDLGAGDDEFLAFRDFMKSIEEQHTCCFAVYDFPHTVREMVKETLVLVSWCPDTSKITDKMVYNSTKSALKKKIDCKEVQANDMDEFSYQEILSRVTK